MVVKKAEIISVHVAFMPAEFTNHAFTCKTKTMEARRDKVMIGSVSRNNILAKEKPIIKNFSTEELTKEVFERGIATECTTFTKKDMVSQLDKEMKDISTNPALFYEEPQVSASNKNIANYESYYI